MSAEARCRIMIELHSKYNMPAGHCRIKQEWSYRMDFHARVWKSDQGGWNSMQGMEIYPVHGISTRGWMEIQPSASKYLDGNPTKLFKDTQ